MSRSSGLRTAGVTLFVFIVGSGCSRSPSSDDGPATGGTAAALPSGPALPAGPTSAGAGGPVLTPEDAEHEAEQRITEQNLESELDRLEREIQGE